MTVGSPFFQWYSFMSLPTPPRMESHLYQLLLSKASGSPAVRHADIGLTGKDPASHQRMQMSCNWSSHMPSFGAIPLMSIADVKYEMLIFH